MLYKFFLTSLVIVACSALRLTQVKDCGSTGGVINSVDVNWCTQEPCTVHRGHVYPLTINFTATTRITEAHNSIHGSLLGFSLPIPLMPGQNENGCVNVINCPVAAGTSIVFNYKIQCPTWAPQVSINLKWESKDANGNTILCLESPLHIAS